MDRRKWSYIEATNPWLLQPSMDSCQGGCRRADGRAECGNSGTSWGANRNRFQKSATEVTCLRDVPRSLPSSIFDFVPGTPPSWSPKVYTVKGHGEVTSEVRFSHSSGVAPRCTLRGLTATMDGYMVSL